MIRQSISGNQFISRLNTNYRLVTNYNRTTGATVGVQPVVLPNGCSCFDPSGCPQHILLFENHRATNGTSVLGMMFNCQPLDGALTSSLECFYQPSCLSLIQQVLSISMTPPPLTSNGSRFSPTTTVQVLLNDLMIEQLIDEVLFTQYYSRCNPTYCIYSYSHRLDVLFMVTLVISVFGGLSIIVKLISTLLVKSLAVIRKQWAGRNVRSGSAVPQPSSPRKSSSGPSQMRKNHE